MRRHSTLLLVVLSLTLAPVAVCAALPQVWVEYATKTFHSPGCKRITSRMVRVPRSVAKIQRLAPAKECALTDAEAAARWNAMPASGRAGFTDFGDSVRRAPALPPIREERTSSAPPPRRSTSPAEPAAPSRNEVFAASDFHDAERVINAHCANRWPGNPDMTAFCADRQIDALNKLKAGRPFGANEQAWNAARVRCKQRWPDDFAMRVYCETGE